MAKQSTIDERRTLIEISKADAVELITLLSAQLAGVCPIGRISGSCPEIMINDKGYQTYITFGINEKI